MVDTVAAAGHIHTAVAIVAVELVAVAAGADGEPEPEIATPLADGGIQPMSTKIRSVIHNCTT